MNNLRFYWRQLRVILHVLIGVMTCALIFPWVGAQNQEFLIRRWSSQLLGLCKIKLHFIDKSHGKSAAHALIIANHVSWLDIFVINAWRPCHFVAKADIRSWPIAGWLSAQAGTIFLARGKQREVRRIYEGLVDQLQAKKRIAFFPEGTTGSQGAVLPFHANLFEAAIEAQVPIQAFAIRYLDPQGELEHAVDFIGEMSFAESMRLILDKNGTVVELIQLPSISTEGAHRREVADQAREAVVQGLNVHTSAAL
ncbi:MAG: 1-acyl-sn-glycerol-3-phosphate acyltransferase [Undibacterium sp.]|nr:1-acyl-sn-glycerol-3-phosphate acyltransferase [Undibacterium sp.]